MTEDNCEVQQVQPETTYSFFQELCKTSARNETGIVIAVDNAYAQTPCAATNVFLRVDAESAHAPDATFRNAELDTLLENTLLPTVGGIEDGKWAMSMGFARERVLAYAQCKAGLLKAHSLSADTIEQERLADMHTTIGKQLLAVEEALVGGAPIVRSPLVELLASEVQADDADGCEKTHACTAERMGTERFIAFVFPPADHTELVASGAVDGGICVTASLSSFPAYVTVHNAKGAIESLPATSHELKPNSLMVNDAAALLTSLHSLSLNSGRNHAIISHKITV